MAYLSLVMAILGVVTLSSWGNDWRPTEKPFPNNSRYNYLQKLTYDLRGDFTTDRQEIYRQEGEISISFCHFKVEFND